MADDFDASAAREYLKQNQPEQAEPQAQSSGFDANDAREYLRQNSKSVGEVPPEVQESLVKHYGKMATGALPTLGMIGGELVGGVGGSGVLSIPASVIGASAGAGLGKGAEQYVNEKLFDEKKSPIEKEKEMKEEMVNAGVTAGLPLGPFANAIKKIPLGKSSVGEVAGAVAKPVGEFLERQAAKLPEYLSGAAEKKAIQATGATAKEASNFAENTGRELLDQGIVTAGANQKTIANRATKAVEAAEQGIDKSLKGLDAKGVTVDTSEFSKDLENRITELRKSASGPEQRLANQLQTELEGLQQSAEARAGKDASGEQLPPIWKIPASDAERIKRTYKANWANPDVGQANKEMYQLWKNKVEDVATAADPSIADKFKAAKEAYGMMAPVEKAAERRSLVTQQHAPGGFLDMVASKEGLTGGAGAGYALGGVPGAIVGGAAGGVGLPLARRSIAPRIPATAAVGLDVASKAADAILKTVPKYAEMAANNPAGYHAMLKLYNDHNLDERAARGPQKWVADGYDHLLMHGADLETIGKARQDPAYKDLMIQASDAKPGSKAMDDIMKRIKTKMESK